MRIMCDADRTIPMEWMRNGCSILLRLGIYGAAKKFSLKVIHGKDFQMRRMESVWHLFWFKNTAKSIPWEAEASDGLGLCVSGARYMNGIQKKN